MKTNTLNLENYGVQKMSEKEVKEAEGGNPWVAGFLAAVVIYDALTDFVEGYNSVECDK